MSPKDHGWGYSSCLPLTDKEAEAQSHVPPRLWGGVMMSWVGLEPMSPKSRSHSLDHTLRCPSGAAERASLMLGFPQRVASGLGISGLTERA